MIHMPHEDSLRQTNFPAGDAGYGGRTLPGYHNGCDAFTAATRGDSWCGTKYRNLTDGEGIRLFFSHLLRSVAYSNLEKSLQDLTRAGVSTPAAVFSGWQATDVARLADCIRRIGSYRKLLHHLHSSKSGVISASEVPLGRMTVPRSRRPEIVADLSSGPGFTSFILNNRDSAWWRDLELNNAVQKLLPLSPEWIHRFAVDETGITEAEGSLSPDTLRLLGDCRLPPREAARKTPVIAVFYAVSVNEYLKEVELALPVLTSLVVDGKYFDLARERRDVVQARAQFTGLPGGRLFSTLMHHAGERGFFQMLLNPVISRLVVCNVGLESDLKEALASPPLSESQSELAVQRIERMALDCRLLLTRSDLDARVKADFIEWLSRANLPGLADAVASRLEHSGHGTSWRHKVTPALLQLSESCQALLGGRDVPDAAAPVTLPTIEGRSINDLTEALRDLAEELGHKKAEFQDRVATPVLEFLSGQRERLNELVEEAGTVAGARQKLEIANSYKHIRRDLPKTVSKELGEMKRRIEELSLSSEQEKLAKACLQGLRPAVEALLEETRQAFERCGIQIQKLAETRRN